ncbi:MAG: hypothetical protein K0M45_09805 [Candidatus Paracaedibacteraceae bacterium]|nr:hypothetical protein [Candidatus Paracaedibacteraceae bacterium]
MKFTPDGRYLLLNYTSFTSKKMCSARKKIILLNTLNWQQEGKFTLKSNMPLEELTINSDSQSILLIDSKTHNTISIINLETLEMREIDVGQCPWLIQLTPDNKYALIPRRWSDSIGIINLQTLKNEKEIQVGKSPVALQMMAIMRWWQMRGQRVLALLISKLGRKRERYSTRVLSSFYAARSI